MPAIHRPPRRPAAQLAQGPAHASDGPARWPASWPVQTSGPAQATFTGLVWLIRSAGPARHSQPGRSVAPPFAEARGPKSRSGRKSGPLAWPGQVPFRDPYGPISPGERPRPGQNQSKSVTFIRHEPYLLV